MKSVVSPDQLIPVEDLGVLEEALQICTGDRQEAYGHPYDNYKVIRQMWSAITGVELTFDQCALMMVSLKIGRHLTNPQRDNIVDIAGYCWVLEQVREKLGQPLTNERSHSPTTG